MKLFKILQLNYFVHWSVLSLKHYFLCVLFSFSHQQTAAHSCLVLILSYFVFVSSLEELELIVQAIAHSGERTILLIGTLPGEAPLTWVVVNCEAARCVWFNWWEDRLKTNIHQRQVLKKRVYMNMLSVWILLNLWIWEQYAPYCCPEVYMHYSAAHSFQTHPFCCDKVWFQTHPSRLRGLGNHHQADWLF